MKKQPTASRIDDLVDRYIEMDNPNNVPPSAWLVAQVKRVGINSLGAMGSLAYYESVLDGSNLNEDESVAKQKARAEKAMRNCQLLLAAVRA